jgi:hypothetical protein
MVAGLVLTALLVSAVLAGRYGRPATPALAVLSLAWLLTNRSMEGEILHDFGEAHGLVAADLAGLAGLVLAAIIAVLPRQS